MIGQSPRYLLIGSADAFHSVLILSLDAAVQTLPHSTASQEVSTQMGTRPASSLSLDAAVQTPLRSIVFSVVSSLTVLLTVKVRHRHNAILVVPHRLNLLILLRLAVSAVPVLTETVTCTLRPHVSCCSHQQVSNSMPRLQVSKRMPTCAPHMVYLSQRHRCNPVYVQLSQSRPHSLLPVSTIHVGTHNPVDADPRAGTGTFPKRRAFVLLFFGHLVNPNLMGTVTLIQRQ